MNALLHEIREAGLAVALDDGTLVITGLDALPEPEADAWLVKLRAHKADLVADLAAETTPAPGEADLDPERPGPESACDMPPQNGGGDTAHEDAHGEFRPSKDNCAIHACCGWLSNGPGDPVCTWRCLGAVVHGGVDPDTADMPRLANLDHCPWIQLEGGGPSGLGWWPERPPEGVDFPSYESAGTLRDLARRYDLRLVRSGETFKVVYPRGCSPVLVCYGDELLAEALPYIREKLGVRHAPWPSRLCWLKGLPRTWPGTSTKA